MYTVKHKEKEFQTQGYHDALWLARVIAGDYCGEQSIKVEVIYNGACVAYAVPNGNEGGAWMYDGEGKNLEMS